MCDRKINFAQTRVPEQVPTSESLSAHGIVPLLKLLVRLLVALLSHVPEHAPHAFHTAQVPSPKTERAVYAF